MTDAMEVIGHSLIQHGRANDRIYLMKLDPQDAGPVVLNLDRLARQENYSKIFAKIPASAWEIFRQAGYQKEAVIPGFFSADDNCVFAAKFLSKERAVERRPQEVAEILKKAQGKKPVGLSGTQEGSSVVKKAGPEDAGALSRLYQTVFETYPFPITEPDYLIKTMKTHIDYFSITQEGVMAAAGSSEKDLGSKSVELTDFATLPECCGKGLALELLIKMEQAMRLEGMRTAYTIARALSFGMNIVFAKAGYVYAGTLVNNTHISGSIESMNVWYKHLSTGL